MEYSYKGMDGSSAVDFSLFERPQPRSRYSAAGGERVERRTGAPGRQLEVGRPARRSGTSRTRTKKKTALNTAGLAAFKPYIKYAAVALLGIIVLSIVVSASAKMTKLTREIEKKQTSLTALEQDYEALMFEYNEKLGESSVEKFAVDVLKMEPRQSSQTEPINIGSKDAFEIAPRKNSFFGGSGLDG